MVSTQRIEYVDGTTEDKPVVKVVYLDRDRARNVIYEVLPREEDKEDESKHAVCPSCHSPDIIFEGLEPQSENETDSKYKWSCDGCGHQWTDDGIERLSEAQGT
jgi:DNA-directed RNA polymerase subunit M/transcription elongation factor TFIIS